METSNVICDLVLREILERQSYPFRFISFIFFISFQRQSYLFPVFFEALEPVVQRSCGCLITRGVPDWFRQGPGQPDLEDDILVPWQGDWNYIGTTFKDPSNPSISMIL